MGAVPTVFVVDDDEAVRDSMRWLIESIGLRAKTFATASEFLNDPMHRNVRARRGERRGGGGRLENPIVPGNWMFESAPEEAEGSKEKNAENDAGEDPGEDPQQGLGCLVLDVRLPDMSGLKLQQLLADTGRDLPIIIITGHGDVSMAVKAMKQGAFDFIEKPFNDQLLLDRIRQALQQDEQSLQIRLTADRIASLRASLTRREREVMDLVVSGEPNREIAKKLQVSPKTVEVHRAHMMKKMGAASVADLVRMSLMMEQIESY